MGRQRLAAVSSPLVAAPAKNMPVPKSFTLTHAHEGFAQMKAGATRATGSAARREQKMQPLLDAAKAQMAVIS